MLAACLSICLSVCLSVYVSLRKLNSRRIDALDDLEAALSGIGFERKGRGSFGWKVSECLCLGIAYVDTH